MMQIYFITTNEYKFDRFTKSAELADIEVLQLKEDVGLYIDAYKGFPGPYLSQVENS